MTFGEDKQKDRQSVAMSKGPSVGSKAVGKKGKKEMSAREKALEFAKNNIPKPKVKPKNERNGSENKRNAGNSDIENVMHASPQKQEYDKLEQKHEMYFDEV